MWKTKVCELLGIKYPILEGGMAIAGNPELAAAVSDAAYRTGVARKER